MLSPNIRNYHSTIYSLFLILYSIFSYIHFSKDFSLIQCMDCSTFVSTLWKIKLHFFCNLKEFSSNDLELLLCHPCLISSTLPFVTFFFSFSYHFKNCSAKTSVCNKMLISTVQLQITLNIVLPVRYNLINHWLSIVN